MADRWVSDELTFRKAIDDDQPIPAEIFLDMVKRFRHKFPQFDDDWIDLNEQRLFRYYLNHSQWDGAKRMVRSSLNPDSRKLRRERLEREAKKKFDEI